MATRVVLFVIDGLGVGALPDAGMYGDAGANTLCHSAEACTLSAPTLDRLGLGAIEPAPGLGPRAVAAHGRMAERSAGKDSMTGHWELCGLVTETPFETFPDGFPADVIAPFEAAIGREVLGNVVSPGTDVVVRYGEEASRTGRPIVYTSADSVFQVAAHTDAVPPDELYAWCEQARDLLGRRVARVIARPFTGEPGAFERIGSGRRDYPVALPPGSLLEHLRDAGVDTIAVGKIRDLFPGHRFDACVGPGTDVEMAEAAAAWLSKIERGLVFANAGDLDSTYAHRNDVRGWCQGLEELDRALGRLADVLEDDDVLAVCGDHGNDPTTPSTDHSREYVPVLVCSGSAWRHGGRGPDVGTRRSFADLGATVAELLIGDACELPGVSFAGAVP